MHHSSHIGLFKSIALFFSLWCSANSVIAEQNDNLLEHERALAFVAPEFREALQASVAMQGGQAVSFSSDTLPLIRAGAAQMLKQLKLEGTPKVEEYTIPESDGAAAVKVYVVGRAQGESKPAVLNMHGGGYILGSAKEDLPWLQKLAAKHDGVFVSVEYRLAPETPFPGAL